MMAPLSVHVKTIAAACCATLAAATAAGCSGPRAGGITELASAARAGDTATIRTLAEAGHDVNAFDPGLNHWTPLIHAIHKNQLAAVDALIAAHADVNRAAPGGMTPLRQAVGNGQAQIVRRLLAAGADLRRDGPELLALAISGGALTDIENPILGRCNGDVLRALLERDPSLRLTPGFGAHAALWLAWLKNCDQPPPRVRAGLRW
jgi:hypothetical protein